MLRDRPGGFRFNVDPVARMFETHSRIVFRSGTGARRPSLKCLWNALCIAITDSLFLQNVSTTKPRCSPDQPMASSENGKTAANQRDHSLHCIPSTDRAVSPPKMGVISDVPCISGCYSNYKSSISTVGLLAERFCSCSINSNNIIETLTVMMILIIIIIILNTCHRVRKILAEQ